jgi:ClpP class serine protease
LSTNSFYEIKWNNREFQTVTAGEFKRTLTPTKKVTKDDFAKAKDDVEGILLQFKEWVHSNRPELDISAVATGETWFGEAALEKGLCDEIKPVDDVLLKYIDLGYNVYEIAYSPPPAVPQGLSGLLPVGSSDFERSNSSLSQRLIRWMVTSIAEEVKSVIVDVSSSASSPERKYMARDDASDRIKIKDQFW